jgi:hypothetical protein
MGKIYREGDSAAGISLTAAVELRAGKNREVSERAEILW